MKRGAIFGITALLLWTLIPGLGEILENAVHFAREGHAAHAAEGSDQHDAPGPEHGCTGTMHLCSCCTSLSFLTSRSEPQRPQLETRRLGSQAIARPATISTPGVYHPPRA